MPFSLGTGTNISHWLSQNPNDRALRPQILLRDDVQRLADAGFDHLRLPVDEVHLWNEDGSPDQPAWDLLQQAIQWCLTSGLRAIVDLHILRDHHFNQSQTPALFTQPESLTHFCSLWTCLAAQLNHWPADSVAFEILNEPVARNPADWNRVLHAAHSAIRNAAGPQRTILIAPNWYNTCDNIQHLQLPPDDPNLILSFHLYDPMPITHYRCRWWPGGVYQGPVHYPGLPIPHDAWQALPEEQKQVQQRWHGEWNAQRIREVYQPALRLREETGIPIHCGEFGCHANCPDAPRLAWYADVLQNFHNDRIAWSTWDYRGGFGLVDQHRQPSVIWPLITAAAKAWHTPTTPAAQPNPPR